MYLGTDFAEFPATPARTTLTRSISSACASTPARQCPSNDFIGALWSWTVHSRLRSSLLPQFPRMCVCMYVCVCVYYIIHTHTHIHTHTQVIEALSISPQHLPPPVIPPAGHTHTHTPAGYTLYHTPDGHTLDLLPADIDAKQQQIAQPPHFGDTSTIKSVSTPQMGPFLAATSTNSLSPGNNDGKKRDRERCERASESETD